MWVASARSSVPSLPTSHLLPMTRTFVFVFVSLACSFPLVRADCDACVYEGDCRAAFNGVPGRSCGLVVKRACCCPLAVQCTPSPFECRCMDPSVLSLSTPTSGPPSAMLPVSTQLPGATPQASSPSIDSILKVFFNLVVLAGILFMCFLLGCFDDIRFGNKRAKRTYQPVVRVEVDPIVSMPPVPSQSQTVTSSPSPSSIVTTTTSSEQAAVSDSMTRTRAVDTDTTHDTEGASSRAKKD
ncbi:Aste57867_23256 [Aphanomyces stellatus]|uniref:Aste57867_23256 protein n=1 Tax=Aphanomyces stellatus TaxID=120398 RepID=A0A485LNA4_9STRA|nr:hypothetical protein As57867_023185 [Aphanomyces stellatus]VFT99901.1 Aste57867_23256 [Aphanomyces stellatus]